MKITVSWLGRQEKRLLKLKTRKNQIASELQKGLHIISPAPLRSMYGRSHLMHVRKMSPIVKVTPLGIHSRGSASFRKNRVKMELSASFQKAICPVLLLAQTFALMPVRGITSKYVTDLKFSWLHVRTIYSFTILLCFLFHSGFPITYAFLGQFNFDAGETIIFSMSTFLIAASYFNLARKWPMVLRQWDEIESELLEMMHGVSAKSNLANHIKVITLVTTICSLIEHLLSVLTITYYVKNCPALPGREFESFLFSTSQEFFYFIDYHLAWGIAGKFVNILSTFTWNFNDIFIMTVSVGLAERFRQLNEHMSSAVKRRTTANFWQDCRVSYRNLCKLCDLVDDAISWPILLCFLNNLYFICSKILKSIQKKPSTTHVVYFWFSLGYLLCRTFMLSLFTASIHEQSKRPLMFFRSVPQKYWCSELKRFSDEVANDEISLTGFKFFRLTRSVVLSVAGTIVTYELVLLQFNKDDKVSDCGS